MKRVIVMTKKRIISLLLCLCLLITVTPVFTAFADNANVKYIPGDVNGDGEIRASDARLALRHSAKLETLEGTAFLAADYNNDGKVTASDARLILRVAAGLDKPIAPPETENPDVHKHTFGEWSTEKEATVSSNGLRTRKCTECGEAIETEVIPYTDPNEKNLVARFTVKNGNVVNTANTTATLSGASVSGEYFTGGTVTLPNSLDNWTLQFIVDYNEQSDKGIINNIIYSSNSGKYEECDNVFRLEEVGSVNKTGVVRVAWVADSWNTGYVMSVPVQLYAHASSNKEFLPLGDSFWSFSADSAKGTVNFRIDGQSVSADMPTYKTADGKEAHVNKILPKSFGFTSAHKLKEVRIYSTALTNEEKENAYKAAEIVLPTENINKIVNGISELGSSLAFVKNTDGVVTAFPTEKKAGTYTVSDYYRAVTYKISDFVQPGNNIDNSKYESVHITNEPQTLETGKQYPLTAYPYPFTPFGDNGKMPEFNIDWSSSDSSVIAVIDGLLIAKKAGTAKITATLTGTNIKDTVTITVKDPENIADKIWNVPTDYTSKNGYGFSETDYKNTTHAIYDAIDEAAANGYNHIIFPKQNFYAVPLLDEKTGDGFRYYIPSGMTVEFPEGSVFYMMDSEVSRVQKTFVDLRYFSFGVSDDNYTDKCENAHLIVDKYYGERYNTTYPESAYLEDNCFAYIGRKAVNCTVEIHEAYYPAGYFIGVNGTSNVNIKTGVMSQSDFVSGRLDDSGKTQANGNWISTKDYITVPDYGADGYFISADGQDSYAGKYYSGCSARVYDILWFDSGKNLISAERFLGKGDYYAIPENAEYFKISLLQPSADYSDNSPWIAMHDDGSAKMCEIKNTKVYNSACGVFSVIGETDGLWVHDCYTNKNGLKPGNERTGDFENGWLAMRHSVVSNNYFAGYFGTPGGYNTFIHTNYIRDFTATSGDTEMLRYINNTTQSIEISEKSQAHIYYNIINAIYIDRFGKSLGRIYDSGNTKNQQIYNY